MIKQSIINKDSSEYIPDKMPYLKGWEAKNNGGFFDLEPKQYCSNPEHKPPMHLYIPPGKGYRHICPRCGKVTDLIPPQISF